MSSVEERNKQRLREYVNEVWAEGKLDRIEEFVKPEYVEHNLSGHNPDIEGIEAHRQNVQQFITAFPDMEFEFERVVADGNKTAQQFTCRGTHEGELMGTPATGETVEIQAVGITVWEDGKMIEDWSLVDMFGIMNQLGLGEGAEEQPA